MKLIAGPAQAVTHLTGKFAIPKVHQIAKALAGLRNQQQPGDPEGDARHDRHEPADDSDQDERAAGDAQPHAADERDRPRSMMQEIVETVALDVFDDDPATSPSERPLGADRRGG